MKTLLLSALSLLMFTAVNAQQAPTSANHNVTLVLQDALTITFTTGGSGQTFTFSTVGQYGSGIELTSAAVLNVKSNRPYNLGVKAGAAFFTLGGNPSTMPSTALEVKEQTGGTYAGLTTTNVDVLTGVARGDNSHTFDYKAVPGFFQSGTYVNSVVYTATQQ